MHISNSLWPLDFSAPISKLVCESLEEFYACIVLAPPDMITHLRRQIVSSHFQTHNASANSTAYITSSQYFLLQQGGDESTCVPFRCATRLQVRCPALVSDSCPSSVPGPKVSPWIVSIEILAVPWRFTKSPCKLQSDQASKGIPGPHDQNSELVLVPMNGAKWPWIRHHGY